MRSRIGWWIRRPAGFLRVPDWPEVQLITTRRLPCQYANGRLSGQPTGGHHANSNEEADREEAGDDDEATRKRTTPPKKLDRIEQHVKDHREWADVKISDRSVRYYFRDLIQFTSAKVWGSGDGAGTAGLMGSALFLVPGDLEEARALMERTKGVSQAEAGRNAWINEGLITFWNHLIGYIARLENAKAA